MKFQIDLYNANDFSVIPLKHKSKLPLIDWKPFQSRRPTDQEVEQWFGHNTSLNIGIVTGAISGLVVIDVDGEDALEALKGAGGLSKTPTVITGRGKHFYFKHPGSPLPNRAGLLPGVDIRADGGYVVAPPSVHESGHLYQWEIGLADASLADLPTWLVALLEPRTALPRRSGNRLISRKVKWEIDRILGELAQATEGTRNDSLNRAAYTLGQFVASGDLEESWAKEQLSSIGVSIGLSANEVNATINSGLTAGAQERQTKDIEVYEILDTMPNVIDRPIKQIEGRGYGVTWLPVARKGDDDQQASIQSIVFRDDGAFFSELDIPGSQAMTAIGCNLDLPFEVPETKRLSPTGFKRFISGEQPNAANVFEGVTQSVDAFVSFEQSLNEQRTMCELIACWIIGTYLTEAFDVVGYIWPNGERGSGKTQLLNTITKLAYLGQTVTAGSSFASIRDEAHYGATIAFDDCENVKEMDPSKRELLLAGNTRGTVITLKEPVGDGWRTRRINSFAPRLFSAINLPDPVLDSRTIRVPMIASADKAKTRRSPTRLQDWPCDVRKLVDDLWLLGVANLSRMCQCDEEASEMSSLIGRSHDIFRMPLAVAYWLEIDHGVSGVFDRISSVAETHQGAKVETGGHDLVSLTLMAIDENLGERKVAEIATREIAELLGKLAQREEVEDVRAFLGSSQRIGLMMRNLGFSRAPSHGTGRAWLVSRKQLQEAAVARGIQLKATGDDSAETPATYGTIELPV